MHGECGSSKTDESIFVFGVLVKINFYFPQWRHDFVLDLAYVSNGLEENFSSTLETTRTVITTIFLQKMEQLHPKGGSVVIVVR